MRGRCIEFPTEIQHRVIEFPTEIQHRGLYCVVHVLGVLVGDYQGAIPSNECWYFRVLSPMKEDPIETSKSLVTQDEGWSLFL
jgi:hypothetical protein